VVLLAWRYELTPRGLRVDRGPSDNPQAPVTRRRLDQLVVVLVLAALSLSLLRQFIDEVNPDRGAAPLSVATPAADAASLPAGPVDPLSLAVLPFINLSPDGEDAYFAEGLAEELLNVLARIDGLKVTSRTSSFVFRDRKLGTSEIAARLGVAHLLEGSVRRAGEQVRITAQLIDAQTDRPLWSQSYERQLVDIFRLQEEISQAIADALAESLGVRRIQVAAATTDLQAYEAYLRGRQLFAQRGSNLPVARELLQQAVARDPQFADAWAALAGTWYVWRSYAAEPEGVSTLEQARLAADKALAIAPRHPGALAVSARIAADTGDRLRHAELISQALMLEPNNANTWLWQGLGLFEVGHLRKAHASFVQAQRLDPLSGLQLGWLGISTALLGDRAAGRSMLAQAHTLGWRGPASRALYFLAVDDIEAGADATQTLLDWLHDDDSLAPIQRELGRNIAASLSSAGQLAEVQQQLLQAAADDPSLGWTTLLQLHGLTDAAIDYSLRASAARTQALLFTLWYPRFRSFREHADFADFAARNGLTAYWQVHGPPDGCLLREPPAALLDCSH
jgi:TolB-like protein/Flp pilus assembly protein TadD